MMEARGRRLLIVDAPSGISGDMFLAAMADLGFDLGELESLFRAAGQDLRLRTLDVQRSGLRGRLLELTLPPEHAHRGLSECLAIVDSLDLPEAAGEMARLLFRKLAEVEGRMHAVSPEQVHFHELGAMDSLVDLVGAALALHRLGIDELRLRQLGVGRGEVETAHGTLPLPAPATLELLRGFELTDTGIPQELVTPTGALILAVGGARQATSERWRPLATGYGAGSRDNPNRPNLLRLTLAETATESAADADEVDVIACAVDDMTGEELGYLFDRLLAAGALDVTMQPVQMKKNRPGVAIELLCRLEDGERFAGMLLRESSTLGLRIRREARRILPRRIERVETIYGPVAMKVAELPGGGEKASPEFEDCARLAKAKNVTLRKVEEAAHAAWTRGLSEEAEA